jgi:hypothetical protein
MLPAGGIKLKTNPKICLQFFQIEYQNSLQIERSSRINEDFPQQIETMIEK